MTAAPSDAYRSVRGLSPARKTKKATVAKKRRPSA